MIYRRDAETQRRAFTTVPKRRSFLAGSASLHLVLLLALTATSCSIPNLEAPECDQARDMVREFYSRHFGDEQRSSQEDLGWRTEYRTPRFSDELGNVAWEGDPYTRTSDRPKAFRAGGCEVVEPDRRVSFELLLFWKDDVRSEQQAIRVDAEKVDGRWLIDDVRK